jgi:peptidoglycan/xylan/chitin deacetylase (PgdA/CDA1 family)
MLQVFPFYTDIDLRYRYSRDFLLTRAGYEAAVDELLEEYNLSIKNLANEVWIVEKDLALLHNDGQVLGLHSHDHPTNLSSLDNASQVDQYERNFHFLNKIVGKVFSMSHPCGSYSSFTLDLLSSLGITVGFRSNTSRLGYLDTAPSNLQIPREDIACVLRSLP